MIGDRPWAVEKQSDAKVQGLEYPQKNELEQKVKEEKPHTLARVRETFKETVTHYFSEQLCQAIFQDENKSIIKPIDAAQDPQTAQMIKHVFLLINELEKAASIFGLFDEVEEKKQSVSDSSSTSVAALGVHLVKSVVQRPVDAAKTVTRFATDITPKIASAQKPMAAAYTHLSEIVAMATGQGSFIQTKFTEVQAQLMSLLAAIPAEAQSQHLSLRQRVAIIFPQLSGTLEQLVVALSGVERPAVPAGSEAKPEVELVITENLTEIEQQGCYVLFWCSTNSRWELFRTSETNSQHRELIELRECPGLETILNGVSGAKGAAPKKDAIKGSISKRWNVSAQQRSEWLPVLHMSRQAADVTRIWSEMAVAYHQQMIRDGLLSADASQDELIQKIQASLKDAHLDSDGYYEYSDNETPLTQSLKATYNMLWGVNQLCKDMWENRRQENTYITYFHIFGK